MRYKLGSTSPLVDESTFIAPGAHVIGNVELKVGSSVWFNAVIRGDMDKITVGKIRISKMAAYYTPMQVFL